MFFRCLVLLFVFFAAETDFAQEPVNPDVPAAAPVAAPAAGGANILTEGWWGPGGYFSATKIVLYILLLLCWANWASWMNADQERLERKDRETRNLIYLVLYAGLGTLVFFIPTFWAAFPLTLILCVAPVLVYVSARNKTVPPHEKVLTKEHLFFVTAMKLNRIGFKIQVKKKQTYEVGPPIEFEALGNGLNKSALQGRLLIARNAPGYNMFRQHIYDAISSNATSIMFDFTVERTAVKHFVDGVWLNLAPIPRILDKNTNKAPEELMLEAAKLLFGGNPEDRRSRQAGKFLAFVGRGKKKKTKYEADMTTQGTQTGEAAMVQFTASKIPFQNLDDIGMSPMMQPKFMEQINAKKGLFILSAPPANGLRSSMEVFSRVCDRFTRDVVNVEDTATQSEAVENIIQARYDSTRGETPMKVLPDVLFKEPRALIVRNMTNPEVMKLCLTEIDKTRMFTTMARAKDSVEAILQFLSLPQLQKSDFVRKLNAVICQRLIRKLCPDCKEPYQPAPQLLAQLGLNPQQVQQFYRKRTPLPNEAEERKRGVCPTCNGIGYHGRTAMFDLVIVSDSLREMLLSNPNPQLLRQQLAKERQNGFMLEGIRLLVEGETTLEEVSRVMKM